MHTKQGIVLAADRRATAGYQVANKDCTKIIPITDWLAITIAGLVSDAQLLSKVVKAELKLREIQTGRKPTVKEAANLLANLAYGNIRSTGGVVGFLLGGKDELGFSVFEIGPDGSVFQIPTYVADGSGSVYALGVLETLYKKDMSLDDGMQLALKSINAALQRDVASGNGVDIVTITEDGVKFAMQKTVNTGLN